MQRNELNDLFYVVDEGAGSRHAVTDYVLYAAGVEVSRGSRDAMMYLRDRIIVALSAVEHARQDGTTQS